MPKTGHNLERLVQITNALLGEENSKPIKQLLFELSISRTSADKALTVLRDKGYLRARKEGKVTFYHVEFERKHSANDCLQVLEQSSPEDLGDVAWLRPRRNLSGR